MAMVADSSSVLNLAFDDEGVPYGMAVIDEIRAHAAQTPTIFWYEVRNALIVNERRGRITPEKTGIFLTMLAELPIELAPLPPEAGVLDLARRYALAVYDAAYLELALRMAVPLATLDSRLRSAATKAGAAVFA